MKIPAFEVPGLLTSEGIVPFEPMGRKMKEWILIYREKSEEYLQDQDIFEMSIKYVASLANIEIHKEQYHSES